MLKNGDIVKYIRYDGVIYEEPLGVITIVDGHYVVNWDNGMQITYTRTKNLHLHEMFCKPLRELQDFIEKELTI